MGKPTSPTGEIRMQRVLKQREKMPALRISADTIEAAKTKFGEDSEEYIWLDNLVLARMPFAVISKLADFDHNMVRDMLTGRRAYTDEVKVKMRQVNKLINRGLDVGVFPCSDLAVIEPLTTTLLRCMLLEKQNEQLRTNRPA